MPTPFSPLPETLTLRAFSVAEGKSLGLSQNALENSRFDRPYRGVRVLTTQKNEAPRYSSDEARDAALALRPRLRVDELFSHSTALLLLGCPIHIAPEPHVTVQTPQRPTVVRGVNGHETATLERPWVSSDGLQIVPPIQAFVQAASVLPFRELVVAADHLIRPNTQGKGSPPFISIDALRDAVAVSSARGAVRARAALKFARVGSESRMETILRLLMAKYGLDVLALQVDVSDAQGRWIGRFDMVDLVRRLIIE